MTISYHGVFDGLPIRIAEIKETEEGDYEISGRQYNDSLYGDELSGGIHWHNYIGAKSMVTEENEIPPKDAKNVRAHTQRRLDEDGSTKYDIHVLFDLPVSPSIECGQVYYKTKAAVGTEIGIFDEGVPADEIGWSREWKFAGESPREFILRRAVLGETYRIRVVAKNKSGTTSDLDSAPEVFVKVTPRETVPSMPYNLRYNFRKEFLFMWDDVPDSDVIYYELRLNENVGSPIGMLGRTPDTSIAVHLTSRVGTVYLYAINSLKKPSYPATVKYNYPKPPAPKNITCTEIPRGANIVVEEFPPNVIGVRLYINGVGVAEVVDSATSCYVYHGKPSIYDVSAAYFDLIGEGFRSAEYTCVLNINRSMAELKQTTDNISATVVDKERSLVSQISAQANRISSVITSLNKNPSQSGYSALTQLQDGINARVVKGDVINQINMTAEGTKIDGKYLHITGTTWIDNDVIVSGMIRSGAVSADKIASRSITADKLNVDSLSAMSANIGLLRTRSSGARVEIESNQIRVYDANNRLRVRMGVW